MDTFVINELDFIEELQNMSDSELKAQGYTPAEIAELRNLYIEEEIRARIKAYSKSELKSLGYNDRQLSTMENFTGEDYQVQGLLSEVTLSIYKLSSGASSSFSYLNLMIEYEWDVMPLFMMTDAL